MHGKEIPRQEYAHYIARNAGLGISCDCTQQPLALKFDGILSTRRTACDQEGLYTGTVLTGLSALLGLSIEGSRVE